MDKKHFTQRFVDRPFLTILFSLTILLGLGFGMSKLRTDFGYRVWFEETNPNLIEFDTFERKFGSDDTALIAVHSPSGIFDEGSIRLIKDLTEDLWSARDAIRVDSITNYNWVHAEGDDILVEPLIPEEEEEINPKLLKERKEIALAHNVIPDYLIDKTAKTALIYLSLKPSMGGEVHYQKIVESIRLIARKYEVLGSKELKTSVVENIDDKVKVEFADKNYGVKDHEFHLTGNPILNYAFQESSQRDMKKIVPFVLLFTLLFLFLLFRRFLGVVLPVLVIFTSIVATLGFAGWIGIELNVLTAIVPQFLIALSTAVAVHLLATFFQFFSSGIEKKKALRLALEKNWVPTILTSVSTAIGFFSFSTSSLPPIAKMGIMAGFGTLFAWLVSFTLMAPLISLLPLKSKNKESLDNEDFEPSLRSLSFSNWISKRRTPIIVFFVAFTVFCGFQASRLVASSDPFNYFQKSNPIRIANEFIESQLGGITGIEMMVHSGVAEGIKDPVFLKKVETFQNWVDDKKEITSTVSIVDILKEMNQTLNGSRPESYVLPPNKDSVAQQLFLYSMNLPQGMDLNNRVSIKNDSLRITAMTTVHESNEFLDLVAELEEKGKEIGISVDVTGKIPLYQENNEIVVDSFIISLSIAIFLIAFLLIFGLKSVKIGLISIIPNSIPLLIGSGFLYMMGESLDIGTVLVGSVCLGIAVDDTIHFLTNFQRFIKKGDDPIKAISRVFTYTVPALVMTTIVLVMAFSAFIMASFVPNQNFGIFVALILSVALIADVLFLPALLMVFFEKSKVLDQQD